MLNIDWHLIVGSIGGLIAFFSIIPYAKDILRGTTRPNVASYSLWAFLVAISMMAQIDAGASWSLILLIGDFLAVLIVLLFCIAGYGYKKYSWVEYVCFALGILAIVLWQITSQPLLAICFAILADLIASIPTVVKTYRDPWSELPFAWFLVAFGAMLGIVSTNIWNLENILFPLNILIINGTVAIIAFLGRRTKNSPCASGFRYLSSPRNNKTPRQR